MATERENAEAALRERLIAGISSCDTEMRLIEQRSRHEFYQTLIIAGFGLACVLLLAFL